MKDSDVSRFDLDRLNPDPQRKMLSDIKNISEFIKNAKEEFRRDGTTYVWSTFKITDGNILKKKTKKKY